MAAWVLFISPTAPENQAVSTQHRPAGHKRMERISFSMRFYIYTTIIPVLRRNIIMEQFELRFIVCGSDLAAARTGAKSFV